MNQVSTMNNTIPEEFQEIATILQLDAQLLGDYSVKAVNGRNLQNVLGSTKDHTNWAKFHIGNEEFVHGKDFEWVYATSGVNGRPEKTCIFTLDAAKQITMSAKSSKKRAVVKYFLHMEKVAQEAYRGNLPALPDGSTPVQVAANEFDFIVSRMTRAIEYGWGKGYVQKMIAQVALDTDARHGTDLSRLIPAVTALPGQKEEIDLAKGEHLLRQVIGSKECNLNQFKDLFGLKTTTPLNETLVALGYQTVLKSSRMRGISGHQIVPGKEQYAIQIPISGGEFRGQFKISAWILNSFSDAEKSKILRHLKENYKATCFKSAE